MASVSEVAKDYQRKTAFIIPNTIPDEQHQQLLEQVTVMQGSIWQYSDSQPWFIVGLHKNNPTATREALESIMRMRMEDDLKRPEPVREKRRGTVSLTDRNDKEGDVSARDSQGRKIKVKYEEEEAVAVVKSASAAPGFSGSGDRKKEDVDVVPVSLQTNVKGHASSKGRLTSFVVEDLYSGKKHFTGSPETKIVIKKTVELIGDMSKSCELVFHAVRACARFMTYPTPSIPSDNFVFGHAKGWIWLINKGLSHFNHEQADKKCLDASMKTFRKEMSLLAKEANGCMNHLNGYLQDLRKLNLTIRREALIMKKKHKTVFAPQMDRYVHFVDDLKQKRHLLVDVSEDRFFPTDWLFEPHPAETKVHWDFFHFQWINLKGGWIDSEFELRSDYSLHWKKFTMFPPQFQTDIIVHLIQHVKAMIEECHQFHKDNMHLSFDTHEIKFLKFAVDEIFKLKRHADAIVFITSITKKLFEDLAVLERISEEYVSNMEWIVTIIEPCYLAINRWLAEDLILPLEFHARSKPHQHLKWLCMGSCFRRKKPFLEMFGEPLKVVLMRTPISIEKLTRFFPPTERIAEDVVLPSAAIDSYGLSKDYPGSMFDPGLGRDQPLALHHPLPKYKKQKQTYKIFDIHRLIDATVDCIVRNRTKTGVIVSDIDTEKYLVVVEEVQRFLAVFATIFTFILADLKERVETLESLMYSNLPEHYGSLEKMVQHEKTKQWDMVEKSGTRSVSRLHRIFQFVVYFLEKANTLEDGDTVFYASKQAYYRTYGKTQSWIYQKAAVFSMYSLPHKVDMFNSLFTDEEKAGAAQGIKDFIEQGCRMMDIAENIFKGSSLAIP